MATDRVYVDASIIVALFTKDAFSDRAVTWLDRDAPPLLVSDFASAEFASAVTRLVRMGVVEASGAALAFDHFDGWVARTERVDIEPPDIRSAAAILRSLRTPLRTADAVNISAAIRLGAALATFDRRMAESARELDVTVLAI